MLIGFDLKNWADTCSQRNSIMEINLDDALKLDILDEALLWTTTQNDVILEQILRGFIRSYKNRWGDKIRYFAYYMYQYPQYS